jgi:hypothetical protein
VGLTITAALLLARSCAGEQRDERSTRDPEDKAASDQRLDGDHDTEGERARTGDDGADAANTAQDPHDGGQPHVVFFSPWGGSGLDQLGRERAQEGNAMGPMSFAVDARGRVYVLDEVNGRIVRRGADGKPEAEFPIELRTPEDMVVADDGALAVLDRHAGQEVAIYDESGKLVGEIPLEGEGIEDTGSVTGVFVDGKDVYVEREHGPLVKVGNTSGAPSDVRSEIPGRPSRDGLSFLKAGIIEAPAGRAYVSSIERASGEHRFTRELRLNAAIHMILLLDSDKAGTIYFAAEVAREDGQPEVRLSCLEPLKGVVVGSAILPANTLPEESFRDLVVLDGGGVIYAIRTEEGVSYQRFDCE